ncbi:hypothetical protein MRX96_000418 [Rhipicephalus microplus]
MAEDCSPQRGPSGQSERSESSLTEPEVTDEEMIEDENAVEQQDCGDRRGCDLSKDSPAPTKRPIPNASLPIEKTSDCKQQRHERPSPKAGGLKGNTSAMSRSASMSPARGERRRKWPTKPGKVSRQAAAASQDADSQQDNQVEANGKKEVKRKEVGRVTPLIDLSSDTNFDFFFSFVPAGNGGCLWTPSCQPAPLLKWPEALGGRGAGQFVASGACSRDAGLLDREDNLLAL